MSEAWTFVIFLGFVVYWLSNLKGPCSNVIVHEQFYWQNTHAL
jgi:hypothetical protein